MTQVKICGITRQKDALLASQLGAYAIGFVFWPSSPRFISASKARVIGQVVPQSVLKVGVFVDQPLADVIAVAEEAALDAVQLHGHEPVTFALRIPRSVIKAVPVREDFQPETLDDVPREITVLLDAHDPVRRGGTGRTIDWSLAAAAAARRPIVLSGGLHSGNVAIAIQHVAPFAVDVASGVESAPGVKDHDRLHAFFKAIRHD